MIVAVIALIALIALALFAFVVISGIDPPPW
jgi:hypothetical protein